jgi:hypothetical protein
MQGRYNNLVYVNTMARSDIYILFQNCRYHLKNRRQEEMQYVSVFSSLHETNLYNILTFNFLLALFRFSKQKAVQSTGSAAN